MRYSKQMMALALAGLTAACSGGEEKSSAPDNAAANVAVAAPAPEPEQSREQPDEQREQGEERPERPLPSYASFRLSDAQREGRLSRTYNICMDGATSTAGYRACSSAEFERIDREMQRALARAEEGASEARREQLRSEQRRWREGLPDFCQRELEEEGEEGGSMDLLTLDSCSLAEVIRRTLWLESLG